MLQHEEDDDSQAMLNKREGISVNDDFFRTQGIMMLS